MYSTLLISHIVISVLLTLFTFYIVIRGFLGLIGRIKFSYFQDVRLSVLIVLFLYIELILGILLYAFYINKLENLVSQANANTYFTARFWAAEHTILMFFALIFGHLALVYARNLSDHIEKFKKNLLYFGLSFILIFISITMNMLRNV